MKWLIDYWTSHGTKALGTVASIISALLLVPDFVPKEQTKWWLATSAVLGVLTIKRGFTNTSNGQPPQ